MKILMVCLGNICRSPLAEGILREKIKKENLDAEVDSTGTASYHVDEAPDPRSIQVGRKYGINISDLRGRQFSQQDFDDFDKIYAMDESNLRNILALARDENDEKKVDLILNESKPGEDLSVPDPYYGGDQGFENMYQMLDAATDQIIQKIKNGKP